MSELISGKEAKLAWVNGESIEFRFNEFESENTWVLILSSDPLYIFDREDISFRIKPRTITLNGIEVPAPFEPKDGERYWRVSFGNYFGYDDFIMDDTRVRAIELMLGAWRTEEEIKQVVEALQGILK